MTVTISCACGTRPAGCSAAWAARSASAAATSPSCTRASISRRRNGSEPARAVRATSGSLATPTDRLCFAGHAAGVRPRALLTARRTPGYEQLPGFELRRDHGSDVVRFVALRDDTGDVDVDEEVPLARRRRRRR